jgi:hypothetical protein
MGMAPIKYIIFALKMCISIQILHHRHLVGFITIENTLEHH